MTINLDLHKMTVVVTGTGRYLVISENGMPVSMIKMDDVSTWDMLK